MSKRSPASYERGQVVLRNIYAGDVVTMPEGSMAFSDVMIPTLFDQVWGRDVLDVRSRRLLLMGAIAANGHVDVWKIQARAALKRGELTPDELRETLVMLAPYAGYPNVSGLVLACEEVIGVWVKEGSPSWEDEPEPE
jgi:4-carboxymuconolactone decarboxylase